MHIKFLSAFNRHDLDSILALYEPDAVLVSGGGPVQGPAAIREVYRGILAVRPTLELLTLGDCVYHDRKGHGWANAHVGAGAYRGALVDLK